MEKHYFFNENEWGYVIRDGATNNDLVTMSETGGLWINGDDPDLTFRDLFNLLKMVDEASTDGTIKSAFETYQLAMAGGEMHTSARRRRGKKRRGRKKGRHQGTILDHTGHPFEDDEFDWESVGGHSDRPFERDDDKDKIPSPAELMCGEKKPYKSSWLDDPAPLEATADG